jgi:predicted transcriptional regulator
LELTAREIMQTHVVGAKADATLQEFLNNLAGNSRHPVYPVFNGKRAIGTISLWEIAQVPGSRWNSVKVGEVTRSNLAQVELETDLREVVRLINQQQQHRLVLIIDSDGAPAGLITPSDVVFALTVDGQAESDVG